MGTLIYILLRLLGLIDTQSDLVFLCFLFAIDQIFWVLVLMLRKKRGNAG